MNSLARGMKEQEIEGEITLGINLSSKEEEIVTLSLDEAMGIERSGSIIGFIRDLSPQGENAYSVFYGPGFSSRQYTNYQRSYSS